MISFGKENMLILSFCGIIEVQTELYLMLDKKHKL